MIVSSLSDSVSRLARGMGVSDLFRFLPLQARPRRLDGRFGGENAFRLRLAAEDFAFGDDGEDVVVDAAEDDGGGGPPVRVGDDAVDASGLIQHLNAGLVAT